jgi:hypothetical protein
MRMFGGLRLFISKGVRGWDCLHLPAFIKYQIPTQECVTIPVSHHAHAQAPSAFSWFTLSYFDVLLPGSHRNTRIHNTPSLLASEISHHGVSSALLMSVHDGFTIRDNRTPTLASHCIKRCSRVLQDLRTVPRLSSRSEVPDELRQG